MRVNPFGRGRAGHGSAARRQLRQTVGILGNAEPVRRWLPGRGRRAFLHFQAALCDRHFEPRQLPRFVVQPEVQTFRQQVFEHHPRLRHGSPGRQLGGDFVAPLMQPCGTGNLIRSYPVGKQQ